MDSDKLLAELYQQANILNNLLEIDLTKIPKGNVIIKHHVRRHITASGEERIYKYAYAVLDIFGEKQIHLPMKNKARYQKENDARWELRDAVVYRNDVEQRIEFLQKQVKGKIRALNSCKSSKEEGETFEHVMEQVKQAAAAHKECAGEKQQRTLDELNRPHRDPTFDINGLIVTDLGEEVRSKNECIFANKLHEMGVPYLYEMEVTNVGLPDFAVFINQKVYFIELLGRLNQKEYRDRQAEKAAKYSAANIRVGENLVLIDVTHGISVPAIEKIIQNLIAGRVPDSLVRGYTTKKYKEKQAWLKAYSDWCMQYE